MMHTHHRAFETDERLARGESLGGGDFADEIQTLKGMLLDAAAHLRIGHKKGKYTAAQSGKWAGWRLGRMKAGEDFIRTVQIGLTTCHFQRRLVASAVSHSAPDHGRNHQELRSPRR
jgi:hypothetical protein